MDQRREAIHNSVPTGELTLSGQISQQSHLLFRVSGGLVKGLTMSVIGYNHTKSDLEPMGVGLQVVRLLLVSCRVSVRSTYSMRRIVYSFTPPGVETMISSPSLCPNRARPTGDSLEMRPERGSASNAPTIV